MKKEKIDEFNNENCKNCKECDDNKYAFKNYSKKDCKNICKECKR